MNIFSFKNVWKDRFSTCFHAVLDGNGKINNERCGFKQKMNYEYLDFKNPFLVRRRKERETDSVFTQLSAMNTV